MSIFGLAARLAGIAKAEDAEVCQKLTKCVSFENGSGTDLAAGSEHVSGIAAWIIRQY